MTHTLPEAPVLLEKWEEVLNEESSPKIVSHERRVATAMVLENQARALAEDAPTNSGFGGANFAKWDPVLMTLVRRSMPNLMHYDVAGVQPMSGPTGIAFAMKSRYNAADVNAKEALFNEAETNFTGTGTHDSDNASGLNGLDSANVNSDGTVENERLTNLTGTGMTTAAGEALGDSAGNPFPEMGFTIEKATVTAVTRALKAEYTDELAHDLKAIHGLNAKDELAKILTAEVLAEMNRELIRTLNSQAKTGATTSNTAVNGIFDLSTDADGRWSVEKFKGLILQISRESHTIAKETRRGRGNFLICSADVASAMEAAGILDYNPSLQSNLNVDDTGNTFAGTIQGRTKVFIDPYANVDYVNVGYKGTSNYDAGVFYCPYVPLQMMEARGENSFQPKIGFKTRYGMVSNPFVGGTPANGLAAAKTNQYYRIFRVDNILA